MSSPRRLSPDDHFMILSDSPEAPLIIGALLFLEKRPGDRQVGKRLISVLRKRIAASPLASRFVEPSVGQDSGLWEPANESQWANAISFAPDCQDRSQLKQIISEMSLIRLDVSESPFRVRVFDDLGEGECGFLLQMHHAFTDGIGFQTIVANLTDQGFNPDNEKRSADENIVHSDHTPTDLLRERHASGRRAALEQLSKWERDPDRRRSKTANINWSPTPVERAYGFESIEFARFRKLSQSLEGTINDVLLAVCAEAVRNQLLAIDLLPQEPLLLNMARSYRSSQHGTLGNRIVAMHPHLATTEADPVRRFRVIQGEMKREKARSHLDEAMMGRPEDVDGWNKRREKYAARAGSRRTRLPGNVTISNVPGPSQRQSIGNMSLRANYPVPIVGGGRFLNITARRYAESFDLGFMTDRSRSFDLKHFALELERALQTYESLA